MSIFENRFIGRHVTIDIDTYFYYFVRQVEEIPDGEKSGITLWTVRERFKRLLSRLGNTKATAEYRRSSRDHVHIRIHVQRELSVLDAFMIRAWMQDDQTRLSLDLARYLISDNLSDMNRCFDEKMEISGIKRAGPWIPLDVDRDQYSGEPLQDWSEYLKRFNTKEQLLLDFC